MVLLTTLCRLGHFQSEDRHSSEVLGHVDDADCHAHQTPPVLRFFIRSANPSHQIAYTHKTRTHAHNSIKTYLLPYTFTSLPPFFVTTPSLLSSKANYPADLTYAFVGAVLCCALSDVWALGKLCSLGTYAARLEEEWRLAPHEPLTPLKATDPMRDVCVVTVGGEMFCGVESGGKSEGWGE